MVAGNQVIIPQFSYLRPIDSRDAYLSLIIHHSILLYSYQLTVEVASQRLSTPQEDRQTDGQTERQTDRQRGRQANRQTSRQTERQIETDIHMKIRKRGSICT